jgi:ABC transport system ATP-binding/permease protein
VRGVREGDVWMGSQAWQSGPMASRNLVNLEAVTKSFGDDPLLDRVSLGVGEGERIAVVGRNGAGKSTLLRVMAGLEPPDKGRVTVGSDVHLGVLAQTEVVDADITVRQYVMPARDTHEWAGDARIRDVLYGLLGGFDDELLERVVSTMSGGERRRVQLARELIADSDLLFLDEPTNHLDVEVVAWLADHIRSRSSLAVVVVTHDRWFLDAVCDRTWEVVAGSVEEYDGGYSAYVLAKAERERQGAAIEARRQNLLRKELAWLRRGAPARTTKPKFRIDAANDLIAHEPPPRDNVELLAFAGARLGRTVLELHDATVKIGDLAVLERATWNIAPGQRLGIMGPNGVGKTTLIRTLLGELPVTDGRLVTGSTVKPAYLSQHLTELDPTRRVLEAVEDVARRVEISGGRELTASQMCERLGFGADSQWTPVSDLSGGERRRLQLTRLLMGGPNVLILDEPTNDFDVETLTALEDLLDSFGGTLLVISHDQYFLERVCDDFIGLMGDGQITHLTGGVASYLKLRREMKGRRGSKSQKASAQSAPASSAAGPPSAVGQRELKKEVAKIERALARLLERERGLHDDMVAKSADFEALARLNEELQRVLEERASLEQQWLKAADAVE